MERDVLLKKLEEQKAKKQQAEAVFHQCIGAISTLEDLLKMEESNESTDS
jgi:hypothetical protein